MTDTRSRRRGIVKFVFWSLVATAVIVFTVRSYTSGQMADWFYHRASLDGYAVNADVFKSASKDTPAVLQVTTGDTVAGLQAVRVQKGQRLPRNSNGVISDEVLAKGKRAVLTDATLKVMVPWQMKEAKGFKFKDSFKHKGIQTWPWVGVWNMLIVALLGLSLGLMAEGFTDMLGVKLEKLQHHAKS
jgi:hypothetical protein